MGHQIRKQTPESAATPELGSGRVNVFPDLNGRLYIKDEDGVATPVVPPSPGAPTIRWRGGIPGQLFDTTQVESTHAEVQAVITNPAFLLTGLYTITYDAIEVGAQYTLLDGDRVLRASETNPELNGIYVAAAGSWARAADANSFAEIQDALVSWPTDALTGLTIVPTAFRFMLWNPSNAPISLEVDPQEWRFAINVGGSTLQTNPEKPVVLAATPIVLSGLGDIDTYTPSDGDLVLAVAQANPIYNGLYAASAGAWARSTTADIGAEVQLGNIIITEGTHQGEAWILRGSGNTTTVVVDVDAQVWSRLDYETTEGMGPVRIACAFDDIVMTRSPVYGPTNSLALIELPETSPSDAGRRVSVRVSGTRTNGAINVGAIIVQPNGVDSVIDAGPGQYMLVLLQGGCGADFEFDGLSTWIPMGGALLTLPGGDVGNSSSFNLGMEQIATVLGDVP